MEKYPSRQSQTFKMRLDNFWFYHKWKVLVVILILCIAIIGVYSCVHRENADLYVLFMTNGAYTSQQTYELSEKLKEYVDDVNGDGTKRVQIITISFSDVLDRNDQTQQSTLTRLVGQIASGPALFYVFDNANFYALLDADVMALDKIDGICDNSQFAEEMRFCATASGFLNDISGFSDTKEYYFGLRKSDGITSSDSRYDQIAQSKNVLNRIAKAYR